MYKKLFDILSITLLQKVVLIEDDYEREIEEVVKWCCCLSEMASSLTGGDWTVSLGDEEIVFDM